MSWFHFFPEKQDIVSCFDSLCLWKIFEFASVSGRRYFFALRGGERGGGGWRVGSLFFGPFLFGGGHCVLENVSASRCRLIPLIGALIRGGGLVFSYVSVVIPLVPLVLKGGVALLIRCGLMVFRCVITFWRVSSVAKCITEQIKRGL